MKKVLSFINVRDLVTAVASSLVVLSLIACGTAAGVLPGVVPPSASNFIHLHTSRITGSRLYPGNAGKTFLAAMFATVTPEAATASSLAQSYDFQCTVVQGLSSPLVNIPGTTPGSCNEGFPNPPAQLAPEARKTFFDGSLTALVVTGTTLSGAQFECRDITNTFVVADNSVTQPFLDPVNHKVLVFNQPPNGTVTQAPFSCSGIGTDADPVNTIEVQFAKI